jgi:hypothetical protein
VVIFAAAKNWTAVLDPAHALPAPPIGSIVGLLAGAYPALRAAAPAHAGSLVRANSGSRRESRGMPEGSDGR